MESHVDRNGLPSLLNLQLCDRPDTGLLEKISMDWNIHQAENLQSVQSLIYEKHCLVGIVHFGEDCEALRNPELNSFLFSVPYFKWVAVLKKTLLENNAIHQLLVRYFYDYHHSPVDSERLKMVLGHAYGNAQLAQQFIVGEGTEHIGAAEGLVGNSAAIKSLRRQINKVANVDTPILITGESGTGKEVVARLIHENSQRSEAPFVAVNCAALPISLIQTELFGHERGSFTGAHKQKIGRIESADKGTIFLDEIGDLPPDMQITLLRFLEQSTIERVGGIESIPVDVRVIAATNVDLHRAIQENTFREDLYYRLKVLHLHMPTLCERGQDLEMLAEYFIEEFRDVNCPHVEGLSHSAIQAMYSYHWPGNIRELMNNIRAALVMSEGPLILPSDLGLERRAMRRSVRTLDKTRAMAEKSAILNAFENAGSNITHAAEYLGVSRGTLYRLMEKYAIDWQGKAVMETSTAITAEKIASHQSKKEPG